jgi:hypothetical protein
LDLEGVQVRVVRRLEIVEHEVDDIARGSDEEELEYSEVQRICEGPKEICFEKATLLVYCTACGGSVYCGGDRWQAISPR